MSLRDQAVAAYLASEDTKETEARAVLAAVLDPADVSGLTVVSAVPSADTVIFTFTDTDLYFIVDQTDGVWLAKPDEAGGRTRLVQITSLAQLGAMIPIYVPKNPPSPDQPALWAPGVSYGVGSQVTYGGKVYKCRQPNTSQIGWEPPNVPALWTLVP